MLANNTDTGTATAKSAPAGRSEPMLGQHQLDYAK